MSFPKPSHTFKRVIQYQFNDVEFEFVKEDEVTSWGVALQSITDKQAEEIVEELNKAFNEEMNVIVHCSAGVSCSGAVVEAGILIGFEDTGVYRRPNPLIMKKLFSKIHK